jgi:hypothetical protein
VRYSGGQAELDPTLVESIGLLVSTGSGAEVSPRTTSARLAQTLHDLATVPEGGTGFRRTNTSVEYLTFAGIQFNKLLAVWSGADQRLATEVLFVANGEVDFGTLPRSMTGFLDLFAQVEVAREQLSIFQDLLPRDLLGLEGSDVWLKRPVHSRTLQRLRAALSHEVTAPLIHALK